MKMKKLYIILLLTVFVGCEDVIEPALENNRSVNDEGIEPRFAHGLLVNGYARIPMDSWSFNDMATDDAVANTENNVYFGVADGQWAANNNPLEEWQNSLTALQYLNLMLERLDGIEFSALEPVDVMFQDRIRGEAHALRALFVYHLLRSHGGRATDGALLGGPIFLESTNPTTSDFNIPRATFEECMQQIYSDTEAALALLPNDYENISDDSEVPDKYLEIGGSFDHYNRVFGEDARLLITGRITRAIRAQAALLAASPAFNDPTNTTTWADAANYAAEVIDLNGGITGLDPNGLVWYTNANGQIASAGSGLSSPEILWRGSLGGPSSNLEETHYPPTLFGDGLLNPTQNLVDAFPMSNGYPITHPASGYDPANPYAGRDPRLSEFIIYNGSTAGPNGSVILTTVDGGTNDGLNQAETSTRTGYYMKKLLRQDVNANPNSINAQLHVQPRIRYTEIYLAYAEAANEAFGPEGTGPNQYSAYDVVKAIRMRAGIPDNDPYLESIRNDKFAMRELIRNERRLELCFEGFRFWDLRRWNEDLTEAARGIQIESGFYQVIEVDNRNFDSYMKYGPVPDSEMLKFSELKQNAGW